MTLRHVLIMLALATGYPGGFVVDYVREIEENKPEWPFNEIREFHQWRRFLVERRAAGE